VEHGNRSLKVDLLWVQELLIIKLFLVEKWAVIVALILMKLIFLLINII